MTVEYAAYAAPDGAGGYSGDTVGDGYFVGGRRVTLDYNVARNGWRLETYLIDRAAGSVTANQILEFSATVSSFSNIMGIHQVSADECILVWSTASTVAKIFAVGLTFDADDELSVTTSETVLFNQAGLQSGARATLCGDRLICTARTRAGSGQPYFHYWIEASVSGATVAPVGSTQYASTTAALTPRVVYGRSGDYIVGLTDDPTTRDLSATTWTTTGVEVATAYITELGSFPVVGSVDFAARVGPSAWVYQSTVNDFGTADTAALNLHPVSIGSDGSVTLGTPAALLQEPNDTDPFTYTFVALGDSILAAWNLSDVTHLALIDPSALAVTQEIALPVGWPSDSFSSAVPVAADATDMAFWVDLINFDVEPSQIGDYLYLPGAAPPVVRPIRPPLRYHPRDDGLGMSSVRRVDANRSTQASLRRAGGTYF